MENYEKLTNAIIIQAVKDYRVAYRRLLRKPNSKEAQDEVKRQEKFFHSDWYLALTDIDGVVLLRKIQEMEQKQYEEKGVGKR